MKRIYTTGFILPLFFLLMLLTGCSKWLDVTPKSTLKKDELFEQEGGYLDVLHGIYIGLSNNRVYGKELSYGFLDVLARYYDNIPNTPQHIYNNAAKYNYENTQVRNIINNIWSTQYNNIANCNVILDNIDADKSIFTGNNYNRIKGEALGLRAFMHFDLLRLFAPAYNSTTANNKGIPYIDKLTHVRIPFSSLNTVYDRIEQDLKAARDLLREFDLMGPVDETEDDALHYTVSDRKGWMSYYAATALLARLNLYRGNKQAALEYVSELTTPHAVKKISWAQATQFYYYFFSRERIFGLSIVLDPYMKAKITESFDVASAGVNNILKVSLPRTFEIYETAAGGGSDFRYLEWTSKTDDNQITKFNQLAGIPLLKIAEVYLIAAECTMDTDPQQSLNYLNTLRIKRGLPELPGTANLQEEIQKEYIKEFLGEGQLFYYFKRKGLSFIPGWGNMLNDKEYVLPLPDNEIEFNS